MAPKTQNSKAKTDPSEPKKNRKSRKKVILPNKKETKEKKVFWTARTVTIALVGVAVLVALLAYAIKLASSDLALSAGRAPPRPRAPRTTLNPKFDIRKSQPAPPQEKFPQHSENPSTVPVDITDIMEDFPEDVDINSLSPEQIESIKEKAMDRIKSALAQAWDLDSAQVAFGAKDDDATADPEKVERTHRTYQEIKEALDGYSADELNGLLNAAYHDT